MNLDDLFSRLPDALNATNAAGVNATIQFNTSTPRHVTVKDGAAAVHEGTASDYAVAVTMADDDLVSMLSGQLDGMTAFMTGKLKSDGDRMFAQRIVTLFDASKLRD